MGKREKKFNYNNWRVRIPLSIMNYGIYHIIKETGDLNNKHYKLTRLNGHLQNTLPNKSSTFFSSTHEIFLETDNMLGHKPSPNKFKGINMIQSMFSNQNGMKFGISNRGKLESYKYVEVKHMHNI